MVCRVTNATIVVGGSGEETVDLNRDLLERIARQSLTKLTVRAKLSLIRHEIMRLFYLRVKSAFIFAGNWVENI